MDGELPPQVPFQVVHGHAAVFQLPLEFLFRVRALQFRELVFHFAVAGFQVQLFRALQQNFIVDELFHHVELAGENFFRGGFLGLRIDA